MPPRTNGTAPTVVLHFAEARRSLKLNKTQAQAMMDLTSKEQFADWAGARVTLSHALARNGKKTIETSVPK